MLDEEFFASIARHWTWATCARERFAEALRNAEEEDLWEFFRTPEVGYMFVWYALIFAVCEALREQRISIPDVQGEIDKLYETLKKCRNGVAHVQDRYWSEKFLNFVTREGTAEKIHRIHDGIGSWIQAEMLRRGLATPLDFS